MQPKKAHEILTATRANLPTVKGDIWPVSVVEVTPVSATEVEHTGWKRPPEQIEEGPGELVGVVTRRKASRKELRRGSVENPQADIDHILGSVAALGFVHDPEQVPGDVVAPQLELIKDGDAAPYSYVDDSTGRVHTIVAFRDHNPL